jgi:hypothetical protein
MTIRGFPMAIRETLSPIRGFLMVIRETLMGIRETLMEIRSFLSPIRKFLIAIRKTSGSLSQGWATKRERIRVRLAANIGRKRLWGGVWPKGGNPGTRIMARQAVTRTVRQGVIVLCEGDGI